MEKYLITGFSGFVSRYFVAYLEEKGVKADILGIDVCEPTWDVGQCKYVHCHFQKIDMLVKKQLLDILSLFRPDFILHLASYSSVAFSWQNPSCSFQNNTNIFLNLLEALRELRLDSRLLSVGSSEEYGNVDAAEIPLMENHLLRPCSPYAVARVAQEMMSLVYAESYGSSIVLTRSFNHIGPGQRDVFVVSSFARQLAEQKKQGKNRIHVRTGDLTIVRDFLDVRDVVKAYFALLHAGRVGEVYNVCSGVGIALEKVLETMADILDVEVVPCRDPSLIRLNDNRVIIGSNKKLRNSIDWSPEFHLRKSLEDIIDFWLR